MLQKGTLIHFSLFLIYLGSFYTVFSPEVMLKAVTDFHSKGSNTGGCISHEFFRDPKASKQHGDKNLSLWDLLYNVLTQKAEIPCTVPWITPWQARSFLFPRCAVKVKSVLEPWLNTATHHADEGCCCTRARGVGFSIPSYTLSRQEQSLEIFAFQTLFQESCWLEWGWFSVHVLSCQGKLMAGRGEHFQSYLLLL